MSSGVRRFCAVIGVAELSTGFLLVVAPLSTLHWLFIPTSPGDAVFLRFIGAFVGSMGGLYLYPFLSRSSVRRDQRLRGSLEATALVRIVIAVFLASTVLAGSLSPQWLSVALFDGVFAVVQIRMLVGGVADAG